MVRVSRSLRLRVCGGDRWLHAAVPVCMATQSEERERERERETDRETVRRIESIQGHGALMGRVG